MNDIWHINEKKLGLEDYNHQEKQIKTDEEEENEDDEEQGQYSDDEYIGDDFNENLYALDKRNMVCLLTYLLDEFNIKNYSGDSDIVSDESESDEIMDADDAE